MQFIHQLLLLRNNGHPRKFDAPGELEPPGDPPQLDGPEFDKDDALDYDAVYESIGAPPDVANNPFPSLQKAVDILQKPGDPKDIIFNYKKGYKEEMNWLYKIKARVNNRNQPENVEDNEQQLILYAGVLYLKLGSPLLAHSRFTYIVMSYAKWATSSCRSRAKTLLANDLLAEASRRLYGDDAEKTNWGKVKSQ